MRSACQLSVGSTSEPRAAEQERPRRVRRRQRSRPPRSRSESTPCCGRSTPSASLATPGRMASRMSTSSTPARSRPTGSTSKQASSMSGVQCDRVDDTFFCAVNSRARPKKATSTDEAVRTLARLPTTMSSAKPTLSASALTRRKTATTTQEISTSAREATRRSRPPTETTSESPCCRDLCLSTEPHVSHLCRCYGRGFQGTTNCWGAYDGHNNMCSRGSQPDGQYAPSVSGYWYIWLR